MEKLKLENNKSGTFCALSCQLKNFFPINFPFFQGKIFMPFRLRSSRFFTRVLYVVLSFLVSKKVLMKGSISSFAGLSMLSLNRFLNVFSVVVISLNARGQALKLCLV